MTMAPFISKWRFALMATLFSAAFVAIAARLFVLHVCESQKSIDALEDQRQTTTLISAKRGNITDARGNLLAVSRPVIKLGVDPKVLELDDPKVKEKLETASLILKMPLSELLEKCKPETFEVETENGMVLKERRWRLIDTVEEDVFEKIAALNIYGFKGEKKYVRTYPSQGLAAHAIGFVNAEGTSVSGVERMCEYYLKGQDGWIQTEKDARRREIAQFRMREVPAVDGMNVELSIDIILQEVAQREIQRIVEEFNPNKATIIISDPATGFICAMASYPSFDPNNYNKYPVENLRNYAISDRLEPGSTFKIVPISAALNENIVTQDDTFDCSQSTANFRGRILKLPGESHKMGILSVRQIAEQSSNRGAAHLGMLLGEKKLYEYAKLFGFGERTHIGLAGEVDGTLHNPKRWDGLTITRMPMGHAIDATPLQIHCAMSVLANQGVYMKPQLVKRVYSADGKSEILFAPKKLRQVISPKVAEEMCDILSGVASKVGTARRAAVEGFKVAGKTGTAKKIVNGKYSSLHYASSFTGIFPADRPRLVITIVVDEPHSKISRYGGAVGGPAFANIARQAAAYLGIQNDEEYQKILAWKDSLW